MSKERYQTAKEIFLAACEQADAERPAFVDSACDGDPQLLDEVLALLALDSPGTLHSAATRDWAQETTIRNYRLLGQIGHGGMGIVYEAEQLQPMRRRVALKLLKPGMDSERLLARFESERQALARMDHTNIARVYDAGMTDQGRPYFAMEIVKGTPVDEYCDTHVLSTRDRLLLFMEICAGVQHAHQKGVIHRDLKPSNVLVTLEGDIPVPKIIDFGIAKAISDPLTEKTLYTEVGQVIGTPEFMSPEQAERSGLDIDTRTDVYALGVLLYHLLVGETPFASHKLRQKSHDEICRIIREQEPTRPSTRIAESAKLPAHASRHIPSSVRQRELRGDVDWIIMHALEKDRTRRYSSASEFAEDIKRHLRNEPVLAGPPSWSYRARKFVRRNRIAVATTSIVVATLLIGLVSVSLAMLRAIDAEQKAVLSAGTARAAEKRALEAQQLALIEARNARNAESLAREQAEGARQVSELLIGVYQASDPRIAASRELTAREVLDANVKELLKRSFEQPRVKAALLIALGQVYHSLGVVETAHKLLSEGVALRREHYPTDADELHQAILSLADLAMQQGQFGAAETLCREILTWVPKETQTYCRAELKLGNAIRMKGDPQQGEALVRRALAGLERTEGAESTGVADACYLLGEILTERGRYDEAEPIARRALDLRRRLLGERHPEYSNSLQSVGMLAKELHKFDEARALIEKALRLDRESLGENHPEVSTGIYNLGSILHGAGLFVEAEPLLRECLKRDEKQLGTHLYVTLSMNNLAGCLTSQGKYTEAESFYKGALAMQRQLFDGAHPEIATTLSNYGRLCSLTRRFSEAETLHRQSLELRRKIYGDKSPAVATSLNALANSLQAQKRGDEALPHLHEALAIRRAAFPNGHASVATALIAIASHWIAASDYLKAQRYAAEAVQVHRQSLPPRHVESAHSLIALARVQLGLEKPKEAVPLFREALSIRQEHLPAQHWRLATVRRQLGHTLGQLDQFAEAEPLLLSAYDVYEDHYGRNDAPTLRLRRDLGDFYRRWGKEERAKEYLDPN